MRTGLPFTQHFTHLEGRQVAAKGGRDLGGGQLPPPRHVQLGKGAPRALQPPVLVSVLPHKEQGDRKGWRVRRGGLARPATQAAACAKNGILRSWSPPALHCAALRCKAARLHGLPVYERRRQLCLAHLPPLLHIHHAKQLLNLGLPGSGGGGGVFISGGWWGGGEGRGRSWARLRRGHATVCTTGMQQGTG